MEQLVCGSRPFSRALVSVRRFEVAHYLPFEVHRSSVACKVNGAPAISLLKLTRVAVNLRSELGLIAGSN